MSRMVERGEDLPLGAEAAHQRLAARGAAREQLDRHPLPELAVRALGEVDDPHAAAADLLDQPVGAIAGDRPGRGARGEGRPVQRVGGGRRVGGEEELDFAGEIRVVAGQPRELARPLGDGPLDQGQEELGRPAVAARNVRQPLAAARRRAVSVAHRRPESYLSAGLTGFSVFLRRRSRRTRTWVPAVPWFRSRRSSGHRSRRCWPRPREHRWWRRETASCTASRGSRRASAPIRRPSRSTPRAASSTPRRAKGTNASWPRPAAPGRSRSTGAPAGSPISRARECPGTRAPAIRCRARRRPSVSPTSRSSTAWHAGPHRDSRRCSASTPRR